MKPRIISLALLLAAGTLGAQTPHYRMNIDAASRGIEISSTLYGVFYEDLNQANDGGISAQMVQNGSFQMYDVPGSQANEFARTPDQVFGWTAVNPADGKAEIVEYKPIVTYPQYYDFDTEDKYDDSLKYRQFCLRLEAAKPGFGMAANGFGIAPSGPERQGFYYSNNTQKPSMAVKGGVTYDLALYLAANSSACTVEVWLEDANGEVNSEKLTFFGLKDDWRRFAASLTAERTADCRLVVTASKAGTYYIDHVTLVPEKSELWHEGRAGDLRKDLMEAIEALHPTFMRFPGGCASEGSNYWGQYFWKNTIGPVEERVGERNHWGTWTSQHIGFYEYFKIAEELGATPLPVLCNGVTCQFAGRSYIAPLDTERDRKRFYDIYVKDALDLIEFCNGGADTEWGAKRIAMGHPEPFNLKYLGIGNENSGAAFWERFDIIYQEVHKLHPEIEVVTTSGASASGREFNANYSIIDSKYPDTIVDEHYYMGDDWFYNNRDRYVEGAVRGSEGHTYDRSKGTRVFVGEFANNRANNAYSSALAEAAYMTGLERTSDMVVMAAYAPLFCKKGFGKWSSNLIWFDNHGMWRSTNYWYQWLFANNVGRYILNTSEFLSGAEVDSKVFTSTSIAGDGTIYVKLVNSDNKDKMSTFSVANGCSKGYRATLEYVSSVDMSVRNQGDIDYYQGADGVTSVSYDEAVKPVLKDYGKMGKSVEVLLPLHSIAVLKLVPVK